LGLNPEKCILFVQSDVKEHTELTWLLGTITPMGDLNRMTQYKEKSKKHKEYINAGLFNYPVLMVADILLYQTEKVPVGEDQVQHVELARSVAKKFNSQFGKTFKIPEVMLPESGARIMSLQNPKSKMSKTDSDQGSIGIFEDPKSIRKKIMRAVTDTEKTIKYNTKKKPGISNLLSIYSSFKNISLSEAEAEMAGKSYSAFKTVVADTLIDKLEPFREKKVELSSREVYVQEILKTGAKRAENLAQSTIVNARKKMGIES
jgi:tryptophanyl-tRNA synthetase